MADRVVRFFIAVGLVMVVAASFGSAAEGKRPDPTEHGPTTAPLELSAAAVQWCGDGHNLPLILSVGADRPLIDFDDDQWLWLIQNVSAARQGEDPAQRAGTMFAALRHRWSPWDQVCHAAYESGA